MYIPANCRNENREEIMSFIKHHSFAILVVNGEEKTSASHIPLELYHNENGEDVLQGHISRGNNQWRNFTDGKQVLVIFSGANSYISSSWYDHENVPTWNYIAVHVYGTVRIIDGDELIDSLKRLVDKHEQNSASPVSVAKMSPDFLQKEIKGITGFEISIKEMEAAYKLSQNRDQKNHGNIIKELEKKDDKDSKVIASEMKKRKF